MTERRYQMTRVTVGDYILPSNDAQSIWRIYSYVEDGSICDGPLTGTTATFWAAAKYNRPLPADEIPDDFLEWKNWDHWENLCKTRQDAIQAALR